MISSSLRFLCTFCFVPVADGIRDSLRFIFWPETFDHRNFGHQMHVLENRPKLTNYDGRMGVPVA